MVATLAALGALAVLAAPAALGGQGAARADSAPAAPSAARRALGALERAAEARAARKATDRYDDTFRKYSKRYFGPAFDWRYFKAQGMAESDLRPDATSRVGARGIMQLMPSTFAMIKSKRPEFTAIDHPEWNIAAGVMHDRYLWRLWEKQVADDRQRFPFMFASYNAGEGTIGRARAVALAKRRDPSWPSVESVAPEVGRWRYRETLGYVRRIDSNYAMLRRRP